MFVIRCVTFNDYYGKEKDGLIKWERYIEDAQMFETKQQVEQMIAILSSEDDGLIEYEAIKVNN